MLETTAPDSRVHETQKLHVAFLYKPGPYRRCHIMTLESNYPYTKIHRYIHESLCTDVYASIDIYTYTYLYLHIYIYIFMTACICIYTRQSYVGDLSVQGFAKLWLPSGAGRRLPDVAGLC